MDAIALNGLTAYGYHGVLDHERRNGQQFVVDLTISLPLDGPGRSDDVADTVNYAEVADKVAGIIQGEPVDLLETLAARISRTVLSDERILEVEVTVHKPSAPIDQEFSDVAVTITRHNRRGWGEPISQQAPATKAVLALGANLGDRAGTLAAAVHELAGHPAITVTGTSPVLETLPVGGPEQPEFLNAVVTADVQMSAHRLLDAVHRIEDLHGRVRTQRWGPRTLDIDIIDFGGTTMDSDDLVLPHPRAKERAFVLEPWLLLEPDAVLTGAGNVADLAPVASDAGGLEVQNDIDLRVDAGLIVDRGRRGV